MNNINEKIDETVMNGDFDKIESIALNPKSAYVKCKGLNIWNGTLTTENRWVDVSDVFKELWSDLSSDCQDYVMSLDQYKNMDFDTMLKKYDDKTYAWIKKTDAWNLKGFGLSYSK